MSVHEPIFEGQVYLETSLKDRDTGYSLLIDCTIFYTNLHELFCQFISWTNLVNSGNMDNCWISCHFMADMKKSLKQSHNY